MKTIFKYRLTVADDQSILMPAGANILSAGLDPAGVLCVWALVDPDSSQPHEPRNIVIVGTGNPIYVPGGELTFIGSVTQVPFVWHVFENISSVYG